MRRPAPVALPSPESGPAGVRMPLGTPIPAGTTLRADRAGRRSYFRTPKKGSSGSGSLSLQDSAPVLVSASFTQV